MRAALSIIRQRPVAMHPIRFNLLGFTKYSLALIAALSVFVLAVQLKSFLLVGFSLIAFYLVEAQMVFLFPLAIDGVKNVFGESLRWTTRAGGTLTIMFIVIGIAIEMLTGGFRDRGFVRSWCIGCLSILIWYERIRKRTAPVSSSLEIGVRNKLFIRRESVRLSDSTIAVRFLFISDLHLNRMNSRIITEQLLYAVNASVPEIILLGGDLVDSRAALPMLETVVAQMTRVAPLWAIAGNHDAYVGVDLVRDAVKRGGGQWLEGESVLLRFSRRSPIWLDGMIQPKISLGRGRILCAHNPSVFGRASAIQYSLTLAGHLHGCQASVFEVDGRSYPGALFYKWNGPRFSVGASTLIVSRGVSDTIPIRFNCPREGVLCEVY